MYDLGHLIIAAIVIAGLIGILYVAMQEAGIALPGFVVRILCIVGVVLLCVVAARFLLSIA